MLRISGKLGTSLVDQAPGLWGSFLPHMEDSIPESKPLLEPVLKFEYFYRCVSTIFEISSWQGIRPVKGGRRSENFLIIGSLRMLMRFCRYFEGSFLSWKCKIIENFIDLNLANVCK